MRSFPAQCVVRWQHGADGCCAPWWGQSPVPLHTFEPTVGLGGDPAACSGGHNHPVGERVVGSFRGQGSMGCCHGEDCNNRLARAWADVQMVRKRSGAFAAHVLLIGVLLAHFLLDPESAAAPARASIVRLDLTHLARAYPACGLPRAALVRSLAWSRAGPSGRLADAAVLCR